MWKMPYWKRGRGRVLLDNNRSSFAQKENSGLMSTDLQEQAGDLLFFSHPVSVSMAACKVQ